MGEPIGAGGTPGPAGGMAAGNAIGAARPAAAGANGPPRGVDESCRAWRLRPETILAGLGVEWTCAPRPAAGTADYRFDPDICERLGGSRRDARAPVAEIRAPAFAPSLDSILALTVRIAAGT